jgi:hypothetical protein
MQTTDPVGNRVIVGYDGLGRMTDLHDPSADLSCLNVQTTDSCFRIRIFKTSVFGLPLFIRKENASANF